MWLPVGLASWRLEADNLRLLRVHGQSVPAKSLRQGLHDPLCVPFVREHQNGVISVPDENPPSVQVLLHHFLEPSVQHYVQVEVTEKGRDYTPNNVAKHLFVIVGVISRTALRPSYGTGFGGLGDGRPKSS